MVTMNVRVETTTHLALKAISEKEHKSIGDVIVDLVRRYEEDRFWEEARVAYERLLSDPAERKAWQEEIALWDGTLMDGLDPDETFEEPDDAGREPALR